MRSIESKKEAEARRRKNQWIIGIIMIIVMLGSTFGYAISSLNKDNSASGKIEYKGYEFLNKNGFWSTTIGDYEFIFKYNPTEVEKINTNVNYLNSYSGKVLYFFSQNDGASVEISRNLGNIIQRFQLACPEYANCTQDWPTKDCSNNFIIIREANESKITQQENCVFIDGPRENLTKITDEFLFWTTGIES